jgi:hypothetical protein
MASLGRRWTRARRIFVAAAQPPLPAPALAIAGVGQVAVEVAAAVDVAGAVRST